MDSDQSPSAGADSGEDQPAAAAVGRTPGRRRAAGRRVTANEVTANEVTGHEESGKEVAGRKATARKVAARQAAGNEAPARKIAGRRVIAKAGASPSSPDEVVVEPRNDVALRGRVSGEPQVRELPSGDALVSWRLVVDRPPGGRRLPEGVRATTVDTLDCVAWTAGLRRTARALVDGDVVEVTGALRRRFWRSSAGAASRCEVEVSALTRLSRRKPAR